MPLSAGSVRRLQLARTRAATIVSVLAAGLCAFRVAASPAAAALGLAALVLSRSFVDYSTSGLENPQTQWVVRSMKSSCSACDSVTK